MRFDVVTIDRDGNLQHWKLRDGVDADSLRGLSAKMMSFTIQNVTAADVPKLERDMRTILECLSSEPVANRPVEAPGDAVALELLEALRYVMRHYAGSVSSETDLSGNSQTDAILRFARDAIAKATGAPGDAIPPVKRSNVKGCSRCGQDHSVDWREFKNPAGEWTHWGICRNTGDPIMMRMVLTGETGGGTSNTATEDQSESIKQGFEILMRRGWTVARSPIARRENRWYVLFRADGFDTIQDREKTGYVHFHSTPMVALAHVDRWYTENVEKRPANG